VPGTSLRYRPGIIICGSGLVHDCGSSRSIGYFLEVLVLLALFAKRVSSSSSCSSSVLCTAASLSCQYSHNAKQQQRVPYTWHAAVQHCLTSVFISFLLASACLLPATAACHLPAHCHEPALSLPTPAAPLQPLSITLRGITNDHVDPSIDTWRTVSLPLLRRAAGLDDAAAGGLELKVVRRGARPGGGGEVQLRVPLMRALPLVNMTDEGMVKRVRGIAYSMRVSSRVGNLQMGRDWGWGVLDVSSGRRPCVGQGPSVTGLASKFNCVDSSAQHA
jgi:hypothetical protein